MTKKYMVSLSPGERAELESIVSRGTAAAWKIQRAHALLKCDQGPRGAAWSDRRVAEAYGCTTRSVENWRRQAVLEGPLSLLKRKKDGCPGGTILDQQRRALLLKLASSTPPDGYQRWTLRLLANRLVELGVVEKISHETVRRIIKKMS